MSQKFKVAELTPHRNNDFFFDDIQGESWQEFVDSIKTSGVIEPVVITQDKVIVSGHQRVRACKALGIEEINAEVRIFDSEDEILKCLIETNIRQRGIGNTNPVKFGRCLKELERIYGIQQGNNQFSSFPQNAESSKSQEDLASQLGLSVDTLSRYKALADMIPEIQTLVETGIVTPTTARAIVKKLPEFQQKELADQFADRGEKVTAKEAQKEIDRLKRDNKEMEDYIAELESREPEVREVIPDDYDLAKKQAKSAEEARKRAVSELKQAQERIRDLETRQDLDELQKKLEEEAGYFAVRTYDYIQKNGGFVWITERLDKLPDDKKKEFIKTVYAIDAFAKQMIQNIGGYAIE